MILSELRSYLIQRKRVTLYDLVLHFNMDADALRGMLDKWIKKGKLTRLNPNSGCGTTCYKCDPTLTEIYEWIE